MTIKGLDEYITGGRYSKQAVTVRCPECRTIVDIFIISEYGTSDYSPEFCDCGHDWQSKDEVDHDREEDR